MAESLDSPRDFVQSGWDYQRSLGQQWRNAVLEALHGFNYIQPTPINFEVPVDLQVDYGTFTRPTAPEKPTLPAVVVTLPASPVLAEVPVPQLTPAPAEPDFGGMVYAKPSAPNTPIPTRPDDPDAQLAPVDLPDAPLLPEIDEPALYPINLPEVPDLSVPEFQGVRPVRDFTVPGSTFNWAAVAYDDSLIQQVKSALSGMAINGLALPPAIELAIFDRARGREDTLSLQATQDFADGLASRGLRQPAGLFARGKERVAAEQRQKSAGASRDLAIAVAQQNIEAVRFALSTAITLEVALVQANTANNELALKGASAAQQFAIDLFNVRVSLHNADWEGFKADAQVFESRIRALNSEIELYKGQVDAQKVIGDVNESLVRAMGERLRARGILIDMYRATVEAARVKGEHNTQLLEQDRIKLQRFSTDVDAWGKQQDGYRTAVEAELGNIRAYEALGNVWARRGETWKTINSGYFDQGRFQIERQAQDLELFKSELQRALIDSQTRIGASDAMVRAYSVDGSIFGVQAQVSSLEAQQADRQATLRVEAARLRIETAQKSAELTANYALKVIDEQIEVLKGKAQVVAQLAASSQSGVNFGASYSGSIGVSGSYGTSWSYGGDTDDMNPPFLMAPGF